MITTALDNLSLVFSVLEGFSNSNNVYTYEECGITMTVMVTVLDNHVEIYGNEYGLMYMQQYFR